MSRTRLNETSHLLLGLLLSAVVSCGDTESEELAQEGHFEALTYNVAGLPQGLSQSNPEEYTALISPMLNAYDLVLVQEDFTYHDDLDDYVDHPYQSEPATDYPTLVQDGLNRFSRFPWTNFQRERWEECNGGANDGASDCMASKGFTVARTTFAEGIEVDVYNHHAEAGGGPADDEARAAGFAQFIAFVKAYSGEDRAIIFGGDTNLHRSDPEDAPLIDLVISELGLTDVAQELDDTEETIDRFFYRSDSRVTIEPTSWRFASEFVDDEGRDLSDHRAVHVGFSWKRISPN